MGIKTGIIYSSVDGQTIKICNRLAEILTRNNHSVEVYPVDRFPGRLDSLEKVVVASSIRYGKHNALIIQFIKEHLETLERRKTAFLSVNLVARKAGKDTADTNPYVLKFFKQVDWKPDLIGVFAGKLDYGRYSLTDKWMIQLIMWLTKGPVRSREAIEYTDWNKVNEFGKKFSQL